MQITLVKGLEVKWIFDHFNNRERCFPFFFNDVTIISKKLVISGELGGILIYVCVVSTYC